LVESLTVIFRLGAAAGDAHDSLANLLVRALLPDVIADAYLDSIPVQILITWILNANDEG
jgi:hypothetical protein